MSRVGLAFSGALMAMTVAVGVPQHEGRAAFALLAHESTCRPENTKENPR